MQFQIKNKNKQNKEERMMFKQVFLSEMILVKCAVTLKKSTFIVIWSLKGGNPLPVFVYYDITEQNYSELLTDANVKTNITE